MFAEERSKNGKDQPKEEKYISSCASHYHGVIGDHDRDYDCERLPGLS
jgi:hypothetical protein